MGAQGLCTIADYRECVEVELYKKKRSDPLSLSYVWRQAVEQAFKNSATSASQTL